MEYESDEKFLVDEIRNLEAAKVLWSKEMSRIHKRDANYYYSHLDSLRFVIEWLDYGIKTRRDSLY
jgi:hypothetical protein